MIKFILIVSLAMAILQIVMDKRKANQIKQKRIESIMNAPEEKPAPVVKPEIKDEPKYETTTFHVAGVTFKDGRESRQTSLRMLKFRDYPMNKSLLFEFEQYEYEGKPAVKILVNNRVIGNVPANIVDDFIDKITTFEDYEIYYEVIGGGSVSYGCIMTFTWK